MATGSLQDSTDLVLLDPSQPLALHHYGNPAVHAVEQDELFHPLTQARYLSHDALVPRSGHVRAHGDDRLLLTRTDGNRVKAFANLCTHSLRPLVSSSEPSTLTCVTCPFHLWSFRRDGSLIGAPDFELDAAQRAALALPEYPVTSLHGLHFAGARAAQPGFAAEFDVLAGAFADRGVPDWIDFGDWVVAAVEEEPASGDWKTFMDVYGDCYHVPPYHPGLAAFADCSTLEWVFTESMHLQFVELSTRAGAGSRHYENWVEGLGAYYRARREPPPRFAVVWGAVYPNVMVECYNGLRVLSVVIPTGPDSYVNRAHFLVPPDMERLVPGLVGEIMAAYGETATEDKVLNEARGSGLAIAQSLGLSLPAYTANVSGVAPELGTVHFHRWWRSRMPAGL